MNLSGQPSSCRNWLGASRPRTWPAALAPVALGSALAFHAGHFVFGAAALCAAFALVAQIAANFANDYFDFKKGADTPGRLGPPRAVAAGLISPRAMLTATLGALALAATAGLGLVAYGGWGLIALGAASLIAAVAYSAGPFPLSYHGLGDVCVLVFFGWVAVLGTYYVQAGWPAPLEAWFVATACGLLAANILLVNNVRDRATDARAGKRTLVVRLGRRFALGQYIVAITFAAVVPFVLAQAGYSPVVFVAVLVLPLGRWLSWRLGRTADGDGPRFNKLLSQTAMLLAAWAVLLSAGIAG